MRCKLGEFKSYIDVATQINIIPQRYIFGKNVCFWSSYPHLYSGNIGAAFSCAASAAHFLF